MLLTTTIAMFFELYAQLSFLNMLHLWLDVYTATLFKIREEKSVLTEINGSFEHRFTNAYINPVRE